MNAGETWNMVADGKISLRYASRDNNLLLLFIIDSISNKKQFIYFIVPKFSHIKNQLCLYSMG